MPPRRRNRSPVCAVSSAPPSLGGSPAQRGGGSTSPSTAVVEISHAELQTLLVPPPACQPAPVLSSLLVPASSVLLMIPFFLVAHFFSVCAVSGLLQIDFSDLLLFMVAISAVSLGAVQWFAYVQDVVKQTRRDGATRIYTPVPRRVFDAAYGASPSLTLSSCFLLVWMLVGIPWPWDWLHWELSDSGTTGAFVFADVEHLGGLLAEAYEYHLFRTSDGSQGESLVWAAVGSLGEMMVAVQIVWSCCSRAFNPSPSCGRNTGLESDTHRQSLPNEYLVLLGIWDVVMILELFGAKS